MVRKSASGRTLLENTYDLNGNRVGLKDYSGKETVYTYDALDRISKVTDNGHELIDYLYNDDGTLKKMVTGGNIVTEYSYDNDRNIIGQKTYIDDIKQSGKADRFSLSGERVCDFEALRKAPTNDKGIRNLSLGQMYGNANVIVNNTYQYDAHTIIMPATISAVSQM